MSYVRVNFFSFVAVLTFTRRQPRLFLDTFLLSLRVYGTPREVIDGFHRRLRVLDKRITFEPVRLHLQFRYAFCFSLLLFREKSTCSCLHSDGRTPN